MNRWPPANPSRSVHRRLEGADVHLGLEAVAGGKDRGGIDHDQPTGVPWLRQAQADDVVGGARGQVQGPGAG
jgi:hypothetical protein